GRRDKKPGKDLTGNSRLARGKGKGHRDGRRHRAGRTPQERRANVRKTGRLNRKMTAKQKALVRNNVSKNPNVSPAARAGAANAAADKPMSAGQRNALGNLADNAA